MHRKNYKILICLLCVLVSCVKDAPPVRNTTAPVNKKGVYIVCEGAYGSGNGSLYFYNPLTGIVFGDVYSGANGHPPGDVFQSMTRIGGRYFMAINNSQKVIVTDTGTLKLISVIKIPFPRNILPVSNTTAYISTLFSNKVYVLNTTAATVQDSIIMPTANPEGMCIYDHYAFICTWDTATQNIYKVDITTNKIMQTIKVAGYAPHNALIDKEQKLWVLSGNKTKGKGAAWTIIDPSSGNILNSFIFPAGADPIKPVFNYTKDTLYYIEPDYNGGVTNNGIYRMGITAQSLPSQPFVAAQANQYFWAIGIDPATGYIYTGDPKGFNQSGVVTIYRQDATAISSFKVGIGPGAFYFGE